MSERTLGTFNLADEDEARAFVDTLDKLDREAFSRQWRELGRRPMPKFFAHPRGQGPAEFE